VAGFAAATAAYQQAPVAALFAATGTVAAYEHASSVPA